MVGEKRTVRVQLAADAMEPPVAPVPPSRENGRASASAADDSVPSVAAVYPEFVTVNTLSVAVLMAFVW